MDRFDVGWSTSCARHCEGLPEFTIYSLLLSELVWNKNKFAELIVTRPCHTTAHVQSVGRQVGVSVQVTHGLRATLSSRTNQWLELPNPL